MQCLNLKKGKNNSKETNSLKPLTNVTDEMINFGIYLQKSEFNNHK